MHANVNLDFDYDFFLSLYDRLSRHLKQVKLEKRIKVFLERL
jgi:hypothetical protein